MAYNFVNTTKKGKDLSHRSNGTHKFVALGIFMFCIDISEKEEERNKEGRDLTNKVLLKWIR